MLNVDEALAKVLAATLALPSREVDLEDALGCILAETILADADSPPFDKALMDGYAVRAEDCQTDSPSIFLIVEEITAGRVSTRILGEREAASIMTGAPLPSGADAVVQHERTRKIDASHVEIPGQVREGVAVLRRGREMKHGQVLFETGTRIDPIKLGVLATVGKARVAVLPRPTVMIVPTGDELVPIASQPGPGQIRETNAAILKALAAPWSIAETRPPAKDNPDALRQSLAEAIATDPDVLLVCGGVSAGKMDLVPETLVSIGVRPVFHHVRLKPGKPLLFGVRDRGTDRQPGLVFGLPGNPVSGIVGFLLFVLPALRRLSGWRDADNPVLTCELGAPFMHRGNRPTYHPSRFDSESKKVIPLEWMGSADLFTVARADGFVRFPEGDRAYETGERVAFLPFHETMRV